VTSEQPEKTPRKKHRHPWLRALGLVVIIFIIVVIAARLALPSVLRWYVNRVIDQNPLYDGRIGQIHVSLWRGAYSIDDIRLDKTTGNVPVPLFSAHRLDLAIQWDALLHGKVVGRVSMDRPEVNFIAAGPEGDQSQSQTGAGGPWLQMLNALFPFQINSAQIHDGDIHFRSNTFNPPFDVYMDHVDGAVENLTNIRDEVTPLISTIHITALAMGQAKFEYEMKFDPFSYRPTFNLAVRLLGLDVTKLNALTRAYGMFDFERGFFDLVVQLDVKEGFVQGYIKPLFREIKVLSLRQDIKEDNVLEFFWEAMVGVTTDILKNPPRNQFGTEIPVSGDLGNPQWSLLEVIGNVLRNAFIRAYLPRFQQPSGTIDGLQFGQGQITEPTAVGAQ
jgi:hypothetical protein